MENIGELCPQTAGAEVGKWVLGIGWQSDPVAGVVADARDSGHRSAPAAALLSMGHKSRQTALPRPTEEERQKWREAKETISKSREKQLSPGGPDQAKRRAVTEFSHKSQRRLQRECQ